MSLKEKIKPHIKTGNFTLSSGKKSKFYVDIKKASTDPDILKEIAEEMAALIGSQKPDTIAGMAVGGIPIATALSLETKVPFIMVRKESKEHGTLSKIEGTFSPGAKVVVVEDVTTTGGSALAAVNAVREHYGTCDTVLVVVDRGEGAFGTLQKEGIALKALVNAKELLD
ncbi:MAG: orotate phosphoribosyltransferase [Desulfatiglandales bacterium]